VKRDTEALIAFVDSRQNTPYAWGRDRNDCIAFLLGAVEAQTGVRVAPSLKWSGPKAATTLIDRFGGMEGVLDAHFERIPPSMAKMGDIAGVPDEAFGIHPMIVEGLTLVCPGDKGNARTKRSMMTCAWSAVKHV
jgi:hypothetical protein